MRRSSSLFIYSFLIIASFLGLTSKEEKSQAETVMHPETTVTERVKETPAEITFTQEPIVAETKKRASQVKVLPQNVKEFLDALDKDPHPEVRLVAMDSLRPYLDKHAEAREAIREKREDPDVCVRVQAREILGDTPKDVSAQVFYSDTAFNHKIEEMTIRYSYDVETGRSGSTIWYYTKYADWAVFLLA